MGGPKVAQIRPQRTHRAQEPHLTGPYTLQGPGRVPSARPCRSRRLGAQRRPRRYQNEPQRTRRASAGATRRAPCCDESARRDGAAPASAAAAAVTASADTKGANRGCETLYGPKEKNDPPSPPPPRPPRAEHTRPHSPPYTPPPWAAPLMALLLQVCITRAGGQHGGAVRR